MELRRGAGGAGRFVRQGGGGRVSGESASWHRCRHLYILLFAIFLFFLLTLLNNADLSHPVEVPFDAWYPGWLGWRLLGHLGELVGREEGVEGCSRQPFSRADIQVLGRLLSSFPLPVSLCFSRSVVSLSPQLSLCQEEVGGGDVVVLVPVETVNDGLAGGDAARHHLLDDVRMVLLRQVLPGHQGQHVPERHRGVGRYPGIARDLRMLWYQNICD